MIRSTGQIKGVQSAFYTARYALPMQDLNTAYKLYNYKIQAYGSVHGIYADYRKAFTG